MKHQRKVNERGDNNNIQTRLSKVFCSISELPQYPNVDPFNYETMKKMLIEKLDSFAAAPFTIQRISELLSDPRKQYSRIDKFMRAVEKTILVVSTVPPGRHRSESENGDSLDSALNGDFSSEVNVDIDMEQDGSFGVKKEISVVTHRKEQNHEASQETVTIKKTPSKDDEAGTSESAEKSQSEEIKVEEATKESSPTVAVAITVIAPPEVAVENGETKSVIDTSLADASKIEVDVAKPEAAAEVVTDQPAVETKPDTDRSAENEILVDTSDIVNDTTPLAALENIVAIQPDPVVELVEPAEQQSVLSVIEKTSDATEPAPAGDEEESSESEAKRPKIDDAAEVPTTEVPVEPELPTIDEPTPEAVKESPKEPEDYVEEAAASEPIVEEPKVPLPPVETIVASAEPLVEEKIDEQLSEVAEIPIEIVPPCDQDIAEVPPNAMETVTSSITENTMSLDEDEPPAVELEMTPIANKMDTDEAEAPMDYEDDSEPMDQ